MLHSDYRVKTDVRQRLLSLECEPTSVRGSVYFLRAIRPARRKPTRSPAGLTIATASTSFCCIRRFASLMGVDSETKSWGVTTRITLRMRRVGHCRRYGTARAPDYICRRAQQKNPNQDRPQPHEVSVKCRRNRHIDAKND